MDIRLLMVRTIIILREIRFVIQKSNKGLGLLHNLSATKESAFHRDIDFVLQDNLKIKKVNTLFGVTEVCLKVKGKVSCKDWEFASLRNRAKSLSI